jgi:hypothetical protein
MVMHMIYPHLEIIQQNKWMNNEQVNNLTWTRKNIWKIFHAMSWNFFFFFFCHVEYYVTWQNIPWLSMKYSMMSHAWFVLGSTMVYWFWTWVWPMELSKITSCEGLKVKENRRMNFIIPCATNVGKCIVWWLIF